MNDNDMPRASLISLATAAAPYCMAQDDIAEMARHVFAPRFPDFGRISRVFKTTGIQSRHMIKPMEWYLQPLGWGERTAAYLKGAQDLFVAAAEKALIQAGCQASEVDTIVTVSSTGIATPSPRGARRRTPVGFAPMSSACRSSGWVAPAASVTASPLRAVSRRQGPGQPCFWSRWRSARQRFDSII